MQTVHSASEVRSNKFKYDEEEEKHAHARKIHMTKLNAKDERRFSERKRNVMEKKVTRREEEEKNNRDEGKCFVFLLSIFIFTVYLLFDGQSEHTFVKQVTPIE